MKPGLGSGGQMKRTQSNQFLPDAEGGARNQFAALCWRMHRGRVEVLLITSRDTGRWVLPKGWPMEGKTPSHCAAIEAWEEAGVRGKVAGEALGFYSYDKMMGLQAPLPCMVTVFPLRVEELASRFPERKQRRRRWFNAEKAAKLVAEPELKELLLALAHDPASVVPAAKGKVESKQAASVALAAK